MTSWLLSCSSRTICRSWLLGAYTASTPLHTRWGILSHLWYYPLEFPTIFVFLCFIFGWKFCSLGCFCFGCWTRLTWRTLIIGRYDFISSRQRSFRVDGFGHYSHSTAFYATAVTVLGHVQIYSYLNAHIRYVLYDHRRAFKAPDIIPQLPSLRTYN